MSSAIRHRGPDDHGSWESADRCLAFGFRRLAIVDLSPNGHQPMSSASGRFVMVFNGEVYNHAELRRELASHGARFRGHSDTEVMLAAFEAWGIGPAVQRFVGMFALAVWDAERRELSLVRDRLGIKPLYLYQAPGLITFGSELKALRLGPGFDAALDPVAFSDYLRYLYIAAPRTPYARVSKLLPGHLLTIRDPAQALLPGEPYWSLAEVGSAGVAQPFSGTEAEGVEAFDTLLQESIALRMEADVPLGALLSGGIDSSTVVAIMQERSARPVKTFTVGFEEGVHDESAHARAIARHLGTDHSELMLSSASALTVVPRLARMFDEPLADASQIPTFLISELARRSVTVALTGDGGDELFGGYNRYIHGVRTIARARRVPARIGRFAGHGLRLLSADAWDRLHSLACSAAGRKPQVRLAGTKLHKLSRVLGEASDESRYRALLSAWHTPSGLLASRAIGDDRMSQVMQAGKLGLLDRMMLADQQIYLPDDLLAKVDRASMAVSLEARVPLLDHRLVEFSWRLPQSWKIRGGVGKWILRQSLYRRIPRALVERPKVGFTVPIGAWMRGDLRPWARDLLSQEAVAQHGLLDPVAVGAEWRRFERTGENEMGVWALVMLSAWCAEWH